MKAWSLRVLFVLLAADPLFAQRGGAAVRSPEVLPDRRVTFRLAAANATEVRPPRSRKTRRASGV